MADPFLTIAEFRAQSLPASALQGRTNDEITSALQWASDIAISYVRKRATGPVISVGNEIKAAIGEIASFRLLKLRGFRPDSGDAQVAVKAYDDAIEWLRELAKGNVEADFEDATPEVDEQGALVSSDEPMSFSMVTGRTGRRRCT